ncbi:hypothetical protein IV203_018812 [Nitzschia inconspicua]|uniref:Uncharacterized protein n=1 Tax=Nitzschia inconspicua TaxID=303405 RepID=A0A9K3M2Q2_9STRA|nr:hypothetical protein IV203_018812 [Nitzschia inconspicua]
MLVNECRCIAVCTGLFLSVCRQNSDGTSLYKQGRCVEAMLVFMGAMRASKTFLEQCRCLEEAENTAVDEIRISLQVLTSKPVQTPKHHSVIDRPVYSKPFEIETRSCLAPKRYKRTSIFMVNFSCCCRESLSYFDFNFALAHHTVAMSCREGNDQGRRTFLSKARDLYHFACHGLQGEQGQEIIDPVILHLLVLAIMNNLGQCYASVGDCENSVTCFENLLKSIVPFQYDQSRTSNVGCSDGSNSSDRCISLFVKNTVFLVLTDPGFAPAA